MELKEFKEKTQSKVVDIIANLGVFTLSGIMDIEDVREAKKNFDELSDLINEYIKEYEKLKFKVGDYVVDVRYSFITEINKLSNSGLFGDEIYKLEIGEFGFRFECNEASARHATQEEIAEYKAALTFREHGRKPFEVKVDDIIRDSEGKKRYVAIPGRWRKEQFTRHGCTLLATVEELEAWLNDGKTDIG